MGNTTATSTSTFTTKKNYLGLAADVARRENVGFVLSDKTITGHQGRVFRRVFVTKLDGMSVKIIDNMLYSIREESLVDGKLPENLYLTRYNSNYYFSPATPENMNKELRQYTYMRRWLKPERLTFMYYDGELPTKAEEVRPIVDMLRGQAASAKEEASAPSTPEVVLPDWEKDLSWREGLTNPDDILKEKLALLEDLKKEEATFKEFSTQTSGLWDKLLSMSEEARKLGLASLKEDLAILTQIEKEMAASLKKVKELRKLFDKAAVIPGIVWSIDETALLKEKSINSLAIKEYKAAIKKYEPKALSSKLVANLLK